MKRNYIYGIITVLIWSTNATVTKTVLFNIPDMQALSISSLFAFLFLFLLNAKSGILKTMKNYSVKEYAKMSSLGFIGLFVYSALYYYGLSVLSAQEACILNYLWPIMIVLFSCILLKEKMTVMKFVALGCSFLGVIILSAGNGNAVDGNIVSGMVCCIVAAACYGFYSTMNKKFDFNQSIANMVSWLTVAFAAFLLGIVTENWVPIQGMQWIGILWLGIVIDAIAYLLWALALKESDNTAALANFAYLTPFLSLIVSAVFLKEKLKLQAVAALIFIIGGILIQYFVDSKGYRQMKSMGE